MNNWVNHKTCKRVWCRKTRESNKDNLSAVVDCTVQGVKTKALLDTGAQISLMSSKLYEQIENKPDLKGMLKLEGIIQDVKIDAKLFEGVKVSFSESQSFTWKFYVANIAEPLIIGLDFLCHFKAVLNLDKGTLMLNRYSLRFNQFKTSEGNEYSCVPVIAHEKLNLPPSTVLRTSARLAKTLSGEIVISPSGKNKGVLLPNTIVQAAEMVPIQLVNDTNVPILIPVGHVLGYAMECDVVLTENSKKINTSSLEKHSSDLEKPSTSLELHTSLPDHLEGLFQRSKKFLNEEEATILRSLLLKYQDIFSKGSHDIGCFKEIKHTIDTGTERPNILCVVHQWVLKVKKRRT